MAELADWNKDVSSKGLTRLSGIDGEEADELRSLWARLPMTRRRELLTRLVDLAEENVEVDFSTVFCQAVTDEDAGVREKAVSGLWENDDRRVIPKLTDRLKNDTESTVRAAAAMVLGHFAQLAEAGKLIERDRDRVYDALINAVRDESESIEVRRRALESVASFQAPEVRAWVRWGYASSNPLLRQSSIFAMGRNADASWLPDVRREMSNDDPAIRFEAANAARELAEEEAVPDLAELVHDSDRQVSTAALQALGGIGGARAKKLLRGFAAMSRDEAVRAAAEESLLALQAEEADFLSIDHGRLDGQS